MGWPRTFRRTVRILAALHESLFNARLHGADASPLKGSIHFPYRIPYLVLAGAVLEKRAWNKLWGARYVLKDRLIG